MNRVYNNDKSLKTNHKTIDKKESNAVSSKIKEIKISVECINKPSQESLNNFSVKYLEILNKRGMRDE